MFRQVAREFVSGGGAHVTHEVNKAHGGSGRAVTRQVHRKGAHQQHLRAEDAKANQKQNGHRQRQAGVDGGVVGDREQAERQQQKANHWSTAAGKETVGCPAGQKSPGHAAQGKHGVLEGRQAHAIARHVLQLRHTPVGESVPAGVQQTKRDGHEPKGGIGEGEPEIVAKAASNGFHGDRSGTDRTKVGVRRATLR